MLPGGSTSLIYAINHQKDLEDGLSIGLSYNPAAGAQGTPNYFPRRNPPLAGNAIGRKARAGDTVDFRFCYGNRGAAAKTTPTSFDVALSTNSTLEAADVRIANNTWSAATVSANAATCFTFNMIVPSVPTGFYNIIGKVWHWIGSNQHRGRESQSGGRALNADSILQQRSMVMKLSMTLGLVLAVGSAGCAEGSREGNTAPGDTPTPSDQDQPAADVPAEAATDRSPSDTDQALRPSSDPSDVVPAGPLARSSIQFGRLASLSMKRPIEHIFSEGLNGGATEIYLQYVPTYSGRMYLVLRVPYLGREAQVRVPDEGGIFFSEGQGDEAVTVSAVSGSIKLVP